MIETEAHQEAQPHAYMPLARNKFVRAFNKIAPVSAELEEKPHADVMIDALVGLALDRVDELEGEQKDATLTRAAMLIEYLRKGKSRIKTAATELGCEEVSPDALVEACSVEYVAILKEQHLYTETFSDYEDLRLYLEKMYDTGGSNKARAEALAVLLGQVDVRGIEKGKVARVLQNIRKDIQVHVENVPPYIEESSSIPRGIYYLKQVAGSDQDSFAPKPIDQVVRYRAEKQQLTQGEARQKTEVEIGYALEYLYGRVY